MRKTLETLVSTLNASVSEIALSGVTDQEEHLTKSFGEFKAALLAEMDPFLPVEDEPLAKGLNHVATFANALRDMANRVRALQTGQPRWMVSDGNDGEAERLPPEISDQLDTFLNLGITVLRAMVNDTAELPTDEELERGDPAVIDGLAKIELLSGEDMLVKTALPVAYHEFLTDPVDLLGQYAMGGRALTNQALALASELAKRDELPEAILEIYPELFEELGKAGAVPPGKKAPARAAAPGGAAGGGGDENVGDGNDPDAGQEPQDPADDPNAGGADMTDDAPQNPIEMIVRLASIIVVVGGSVLQAGGGNMADDTNPGDEAGMPSDMTGAGGGGNPLQRRAPVTDIGDVPLAKILRGEIAVAPDVADALEAGMKALTENADLKKRLGTNDASLAALRATVARLEKAAAPAKGIVSGQAFTLGKADDVGGGLAKAVDQVAAVVSSIDTLQKSGADPEGDLAARQLMRLTHATGGQPFVPEHLSGPR